MRNFLIYNSKSSLDCGLTISGSGTYGMPERDVERIEIPGRNGSLIVDKDRYKNIQVTYKCGITADFRSKSYALRSWLCSSAGYHRLADSYHPEFYRMASYDGSADFDMDFLNRAGEIDLVFNCKPQRFRADGDTPVTFTAAGYLYNPEAFDALPIITVYGSGAGAISVGGVSVSISAIDDSVTLDSELQDAYKGLQNKNSTITADSFPVLAPGKNVVSFSGGVAKVEIIPRWWTI